MLENLSVIAIFVVIIGLVVGALFLKGKKNKKEDSEFFRKSEEISVAFTDRVREKRGKN